MFKYYKVQSFKCEVMLKQRNSSRVASSTQILKLVGLQRRPRLKNINEILVQVDLLYVKMILEVNNDSNYSIRA